VVLVATAIAVGCERSAPLEPFSECVPQIEPGDGEATTRIRIERDGSRSHVEVVESSGKGGFGELALIRERDEIDRPREEVDEVESTERYPNIRRQDRIVVARPHPIRIRNYDLSDAEAASERGAMLFACGEFEARLVVEDVLCATAIEREFIVGGGLDHVTCQTGLIWNRPQLFWLRDDGGGWYINFDYRLHPTPDGDFAITEWDARDLLLDRLEREIPAWPENAPPYYALENDVKADRGYRSAIAASPRYALRGDLVYPRTGVLLSEAKRALRGLSH